ncbi:MAG: tRNA epoxyqueuosine(34) reductase QueG, partial [Gemmatimonadaceae bacterium]
NLYGCDICQEVCPWNVKFSRDATESAFVAREVIAGKDARTLADEISAMDDATFRTVFKRSPIKRAKRSGLVRNAGVVLANLREECSRSP